MRRRRRRWRNRIGIVVPLFDGFASSRSDGPPVVGAFKPRIIRKPEPVAERRLLRTRRSVVEGKRRSATHVSRGANPGLESPGYRHDIAPRWAALDLGEAREIAQLRRLWESIELEIIRVLEAGHAGKIRNPNIEIRNKFQK